MLCIQTWLFRVCFGPLSHFSVLHFFPLSYSKIKKTQENFRIFIFWRKVRVLFEDGNTYLGITVCKDPETDMWVTVFEDGEEDQTEDLATDSDYTLLD